MTAANADPRQLKLELIILELRSRGWTEEEVADRTGLSRQSVGRRFTARVAEILDALGGEFVPPERTSSPSACLQCGLRPRIRSVTKRRIVTPAGGRTTVTINRPTSLCIVCHPGPRRRERLTTLVE